MLKQRIATAVALLFIFFGVLLVSQTWVFPVFMMLVVAVAAWEWARLSGFSGSWSLFFVFPVVGICTLMLLLQWHTGKINAWIVWMVIVWSLFWLFLATYMLHVGISVWKKIPGWLRLTIGWITLVMLWLAVVHLHTLFGVMYLLSILALVWVADIAAYFFGRAFGKHKLAMHISPGKSWEGALGGVLSGQVLAFVCAFGLTQYPNFYNDVQQQYGSLALSTITAGLTAVSVAGDLLESLMKRGVGMKDSSNLLPGHGGVLDRIDALLPVLPMALVIAIFATSQ